jgi:hypothetical protein
VLRLGGPIALVSTLLVLLAGTSPAAGSSRTAVLMPVVGAAPTSRPIPPGFLGLSMEFYAVHQYTGSDPDAIDPVLVQLIRNLNPGQAPVLRIGGDSTDQSWWPVPGVLPPRGIDYPLTQGWIRTTSALARTLGAKLIVGINLMLNRPALAAVEARALLAGLGSSVEALEIGNEPDLYGTLPWYLTSSGTTVYGRPRSYNVAKFAADFAGIVRALPRYELAGPSFASLNWLSGLGPLIAAEPRLRILTVHRYPLHGCGVDPSSPTYATIPNLLSDASQSGLASALEPSAALAHAQGLSFRVDEMNSVSCFGSHSVSDSFASALWMLDTLFELANVGVDGVNIHTLPSARYAPFSLTHAGGQWLAGVRPDYYGMLMFAQAAPAGSRLLPVSGVPDGSLKVFSTVAPDGTVRVVLINEDPAFDQPVQLTGPPGASSATVERLTAPGLDATSGVTLGGQSFAGGTATGMLAGQPQSSSVSLLLGTYFLTVPAASAELLTFN